MASVNVDKMSLKELLDLGAITREEYDAKKAEWLKRL